MKNFTLQLAILSAAFLLAALISARLGAPVIVMVAALFVSVVSGTTSMTKSVQ
jgi:hypothetical protein